MSIVYWIENNLWLIFVLCYLYQGVYTAYMLAIVPFIKKDYSEAAKQYKYGVVIAARNEELVIGPLIESINAQDYPADLLTVYVVADNSMDNTAAIAEAKGAVVYERDDLSQIGKGYAMNHLFEKLLGDPDCDCDAFIIFDADNIVDPNYVKEINKTFCKGYKAVVGYRNSKNYASNWISAGYSLWFLHDSKFLNNPRMLFKTSCLVSGTGFLVSREIIERNQGWKYFSLTEDVEFSAEMIIRGEKIGYCGDAVFFDEQPVNFKQSWDQRIRWAKGFYQVVWRYGSKLVRGVFKKHGFACFDMLMSIFPILLITLVYFIVTIVKLLIAIVNYPAFSTIIEGVLAIMPFIAVGYLVLFCIGLTTTITEWEKINCRTKRKIWYTFTFPIFMMTFIPIAGVAFFKKVEWKPIEHTIVKKIEDMLS